ncbi:MAG TPA: hypothetical protein VK623_07430 [Flavobacterium sp.]|nr:hypothetical protein [Flavobacterium sp.]
MDITLTAENKDEYLLIATTGNLETVEDLLMHADLIYQEFLKYGAKKVLLDLQETTFPKNLFSYLDLVNHYISDFSQELQSIKLAVVVTKEYENIGEFWETVCNNRGYEFFAFTSYEKAHDWLMK